MIQMLDGFPIQDSGENIDILGELCDAALRQPGARFTVDEAGGAIVEIMNQNGDLLTADLTSPRAVPPIQEVE